MISKFLKAILECNLIEEGDKIAVGVSGGKDSMVLATVLNEISKFSKTKFKVVGISLDCTNGQADYSQLKKYFSKIGMEFYVEKTNIFEVVFDIRHEKNPCSLCANLRRGSLNDFAKKLGCNKVALGHHADDLIETFLLSLFYEGRVNTFKAKTYFTRADLTQIRPMIFASESDVINFVKKHKIPILKNCCKANKNTKREFIKQKIAELEKEIPNFKKQIFNAAIKLCKEN